jgi:hypothetical protein
MNGVFVTGKACSNCAKTRRTEWQTLLADRVKRDGGRTDLFYLVNGLQAGSKSCYYRPLIPSHILLLPLTQNT